MSGFFACSGDCPEALPPRLGRTGVKILLDLILGAATPPRVLEVPHHVMARTAGVCKPDAAMLVQSIWMLLDKAAGDVLPMRFLVPAPLGLVGVGVNPSVLELVRLGEEGLATTGIATTRYAAYRGWSSAGAAIGVVWNHAAASTLIWRAR